MHPQILSGQSGESASQLAASICLAGSHEQAQQPAGARERTWFSVILLPSARALWSQTVSMRALANAMRRAFSKIAIILPCPVQMARQDFLSGREDPHQAKLEFSAAKLRHKKSGTTGCSLAGPQWTVCLADVLSFPGEQAWH